MHREILSYSNRYLYFQSWPESRLVWKPEHSPRFNHRMKTERGNGSSKADLKPTGYRNTVGRATFLYQSNARLRGTSFHAWWSGITTNHRQPHCLLPFCPAANSLIRIPHKYRHCAQAKRQHKTGKAIRFKSSPAYSPLAFFFFPPVRCSFGAVTNVIPV